MDQRYLAAKIERSQGDVYVAVYAVKHRSGTEHLNNRIRVQLDILESAPMDTGMVKIDTKSLEQLVVTKTFGGPKGHERVKVRGRGTKEARWTEASSLAHAPTNHSLSFLFV